MERAISNDNAIFDADGLDAALDRFAGLSSITTAMAHRNALPVTITEKLVSLVSGEVFDYLVNHHELPPQIAIDHVFVTGRLRAESIAIGDNLGSDHRPVSTQIAIEPATCPGG